MSFSKTSVMKIVKQISLTMTFKSVVLPSWFTVVFPPRAPLCIFVSGLAWEAAAVWILDSEVGGNFPPVGVGWFGFYFLFLGLLCFSVPCPRVR